MTENLPKDIAFGVIGGLWGFALTWVPLHWLFTKTHFLRDGFLSILQSI